MLEKTRGIFLHYINYSDSSIIARIYTEKFGQQSYLVNGIHSRRGGLKINLFQPLFLLELEVYYKPGRTLQRIKSFRMAIPFEQIPFDVKRSSQAIFLSEVLMKCLKEEESNPGLFEFLFHSACLLDLKDQGNSNFLIAFLFRLTQYLGIFPRPPEDGGERFFDLVSASFMQDEPFHHQFMNAEATAKFTELFRYDLSEIEKLSFQNRHRTVLLSKLLEYYKIHLDLSGEMKSLAVLKEILG